MSQGFSISNKEERMIFQSETQVVSEREYNGVLGAVVCYGILANVLMVKFLTPYIWDMNIFVLLIGYIVCCIAGCVITYRSSNPLISFIGYNLVVVPVGALLSVAVRGYAPEVVGQAFFLTAVVTLVMLLVTCTFPAFFAGLGRMLLVALIGLLLARLICMLFGVYPTVISWIAAGLFSLYIGYNWVKAQSYIKTVDNAVDSALDIYLDIINVFLRILQILGKSDK